MFHRPCAVRNWWQNATWLTPTLRYIHFFISFMNRVKKANYIGRASPSAGSYSASTYERNQNVQAWCE